MKKRPLTANQDRFPDVTLTEFRGILYMHLGTDWIQGAMRLGKPNAIVLDYVQHMMMWMLFKNTAKHIVQLGLGSAALTKFCYHNFPEAKVTAVELNPHVIDICRSTFHLPPDDNRLNVLEADAALYIESMKRRKAIDILQIDLYDEHAAAPVFDTPQFYQSCADALTPDGMMTVNIFGNDSNRQKSIEAMQDCFESVIWTAVEEGQNMVVLCGNSMEAVLFDELEKRSKQIKRTYGLKAEKWVAGLAAWMQGEDI